MNSLVEEYRKLAPNDPRGDDEITLLLGQANDQDGRYEGYDGYPQFKADYEKLKAGVGQYPGGPEIKWPVSVGEEFTRGMSRGMSSLKASALGIGALGAGMIGAEGAKAAMVKRFKETEEESQKEAPASVPRLEDIHSAEDALRYGMGKAGEFVPNIGEALAFGAAGAAVGSAAEPVGGTVAGAATGFLSGFLRRQAVKSALRALVDKGAEVIEEDGVRAVVKGQLETLAKGEAVAALEPATKLLLETEGKALARKYGVAGAEALNFGALSAGGEYPVTDSKTAALIAGIGGSAGALLPTSVISKLFPGVGQDVATSYLRRLASNAAQHIPAGTVSMAAMELGNIAAERYADPERRDQPLTDEELSRLLNASVVGGMMGAGGAAVTALRGPRTPTGKELTGMTPEQVVEEHRGERLKAEGQRLKEDGDVISKEGMPITGKPTASETSAAAAGAETTTAPAAQGVVATASATPTAPARKDLTSEPGLTEEQQADLQRKRAAAAVTVKGEDPAVQAAQARMAQARAQTNPSPTIKEKLSGKYAKGKLDGTDVGLPGLTISIETPKGAERTGIGPNGKPWKVEMPGDYGYFLGTMGKDKDHVDVTLGPNPKAETVYVVDQIDPGTGKFDEHKTFVGFESQTQAEAAYDASFSNGSGPQRRGAVTGMQKSEFTKWVKDPKQTKQALKYEEPKAELKKGAEEHAISKEELYAQQKYSPVEIHAHGGESEVSKPHVEPAAAEGGEGVRGGGRGKEGVEPAGAVKVKPEAKAVEAKKGGEELSDAELLKLLEAEQKKGAHEQRQSEKQGGAGERGAVQGAEGKTVGAGGERPGGAGGVDRTKEVRGEAVRGAEPLTPEAVDVEGRGTVAESARGRKGKGKATVEPAWFRPKGDESLLRMEERLLSEASPPSGQQRNSQTGRLTALLDKVTGKVHLVSTFENNDEARVTKFGDRSLKIGDGKKETGRVKSWALTDILKAKQADGLARYEVIGSARTKKLHEYAHQEYADRGTFEREFAGPVEERQAAVRKGAAAVEGKLAEAGVRGRGEGESGGAAEREGMEEERNDEASVGPSFEREPEAINLKPDEVRVLREQMPKVETFDDLLDILARKRTGQPVISDELFAVIKKISEADPQFFLDMENLGLQKTLKRYGYEINAGTGAVVEPGAVGTAGGGVPHPERGMETGAGEPEAAVESGQNRPGQGGQTAAGEGAKGSEPGHGETGAAGEVRESGQVSGPEGVKLRLPESQPKIGDSQQEELLRSIHEAAARAGIRVVRVTEDDPIMGILGLKKGVGAGAYDKKNRTILQVLGDTIGSRDVATALHEVGHDVFAGETPEVRERLVRAIDRLSDEALGVDTSSDSRIRAADPAQLGKEAVNEERLVEATAKRLQEEGFDPEQARGFAQRFVRTLKDLYMRAAMAVQRWMGFEESPELARRYFENRIRSLLAGDRVGESYVDFLGARKRSVAQRRQDEFGGTRVTAQTYRNGVISYESAPNLSLAATRFNLDGINEHWKFRDPDEPTRESRRTDIEKLAAVLNHKAELVKRAGQALLEDKKVAELIIKSKKTPEKYLSDLLGIRDPMEARALLDAEKESDGTPVAFDREKTIDGFKGKANADKATLDAYAQTQAMLSKLGRVREESEREMARTERALRGQREKLAKAEADWKEFQAIKSDTTKVIPNLDRQETRFKRRLADARLAVAASNRDMMREGNKLAVIEAANPVIGMEQRRLSAKLEVRPEFVFRDQAEHIVPENPNAKTEDLAQWKNRQRLKLDPSGTVTKPEELERQLAKKQAFLDNREAQARGGDENALDIGYQTVAQELHEILARTVGGLDHDVAPSKRWNFTLSVLADGKRMAEAVGSRAARSVTRRLNEFVRLADSTHAHNERMGRITGQLENVLLALVPKLGGRDILRRDILTPTRDKLSHQHDLEELHADNPGALKTALYRRVREMLLTTESTRPHVAPVIDRFMPALTKLVDHQWEMAKYRLDKLKTARMGVADERLGTVVDPVTGKRVALMRRHVEIGAFTFPRKFERNFATMVKALRGSDWERLGTLLKGGEDAASPLEEALLEGADKARELLRPFFEHPEHWDQVQNEFIRALAETAGTFDWPGGEEGTRPADAGWVKAALEESGAADPVGFAQRLFELGSGEGNGTGFVLDTIRRLHERFVEADNMYRQFESTEVPEGKWAIRGMSPDALIDARNVEHLPARWFDYHDYDRRESFGMAQRIAAEIAFGRGQEGLASDFDATAKEVERATTRMREVTREMQRSHPGAGGREVERLVKERLGTDYETVSRLAKHAKFVSSTVRGLSDYFRKEGSPDLTLNWASKFAHTLGQLLVNQPMSALNQMEQLFGLHLRYGAGGSTFAGTARTLKKFGSEVVHSLAQAVGLELQDKSWTHRMWTELGLSDPGAVMKMRDAMVRQHGETATTQALRGISDVMGFSVNRLGAKAEHTTLTPAHLFNFVATASEKALTESLWQMVGAHLGNGVEFLRSHPEALQDAKFKLTSKSLGLTGREAYTFDRLTGDMHNWNMDFTDMTHEALRRRDGRPFSNEDALKLYSMGLSEVLGKSSLATMPSSSYTNSIYRVISPLLGWSFRRGMSVLEAGRTADGKRDLASMANGLAGLAVLAAGGLGTSAVVNAYAEDVLGKKRNLRSMTGPTAGQAVLGMWENLNRVGSLGLLGEGVNGLINVGTGADNRILDVDKRVVALSAIGSLTSAISSFINQGAQADYARVVRPMLTAMGGGGALQYLQLANRTLGLDNRESRAVARTNARNWLLAAGRELQMDVREPGMGAGGYSQATPVSPALTRMELAAYGNNSGEFQEAYKEAVQRAKEAGNPDPVDYVKRAFSARNPLRSIFRTAPSELEYQRLLAALPDTGREDVRQAVDYFNAFAERIGANGFEGKAEKSMERGNVGAYRMPTFYRAPSFGTVNAMRGRAAAY